MKTNPWISAAIIVVVSLILLLPQLGHKSLWPDEAFYAQIAKESPKTILFAAKNDFHPPGFLLAQHVMVSIFGSSEFALRLLSGLAWVGIVLLTWLWGSKVLGPKVGWVAGLTAAISHFGLLNACNATSYSLFSALSVAALFAFWWAIEEKGGVKAWLLYALAQTACVYTHHYGWGTFAAVNLYFLITLKNSKRQWLPWLISNVAIIILYLPLLSTTLQQLTLRTEMLAKIRPQGVGLRLLVQRLAGLFYHMGAGYVFSGPEWGKVFANPLFWLTALIVFSMVFWGIYIIISKPKIALFLGIFLVTNVVGMLKSQADVLSFPNLTVVFFILAATAAVDWTKRMKPALWWIAMVPLWVVNGVGYGMFSSSTATTIFSRSDFRAAVERIKSEIQPNDIIMTDLQKTGTPAFEYYYHGKFITRDHYDEYHYEFSIPDVEVGRFQSTTLLKDDLQAAFDKGVTSVWYITRYGLGRMTRKQADEAIRIFPADIWDDGELLVVRFYPRLKSDEANR
jgi:uncharacterized membrane protein